MQKDRGGGGGRSNRGHNYSGLRGGARSLNN